MGGKLSSATNTVLPNKNGWVAHEFKEYDFSRSKVINIYKSLDRLKKGGYGTVYKVERVGSREIYALKYIPISEDVEFARREAEIMQKIEHKSVVRVHSSFALIDDRGKDVIAYCIVMDFVEGSDLREYMQSLATPLPRNYVMECFIKLTEALAYLHKAQIYHCDLKPENIIITSFDQGVNVTIVDFGSAGHKLGPNSHSYTPLLSTKAYMAPELIKSKTTNITLSGKADMWALGCILYEIWTQDSTFINEGFGMASKLGKDPELLNKLGDMAIVLILRLILEPAPEKRITADKLMEHPIFQGWRVAIDEQHTARSTQPSSALFLFPFVSVLSFSSSGPNLCYSNLQFISSWLDYHRVLVSFDCTLSIIRFVAQSKEPNSVSLALHILDKILTHMYGTHLAYQLCTSPIGISTLLKRKSFVELLKLLRYSFGHATLQRCFAIDNMTRLLLQSSNIENMKVGLGLYADLPETTVPLSLYLEKLGKLSTDINIKMAIAADFLNKHRDIPRLLEESPGVYDKMEKLLCSCLSVPKSKHIPQLLNGVS